MTISLLQNAQPLNVVYSPIVIFMEKGKRQIYMLYIWPISMQLYI